jgi:hypothetical protein
MAAGIVIYAIVNPGDEFTALGHLVSGAITAGIGALCGAGVWALGRTGVIYEAPKR